MAWGIVAGSVGSALIGSMAAGDAADAQAGASASATAEQRRQFDLIQQQQEPFRAGGEAGLNELLKLYGLTPNTGKTLAQLREQVMPGYTSAAQAPTWVPEQFDGRESNGIPGYWQNGTSGTVNETGLNTEVNRLYAAQEAERTEATRDPAYGSAMRDFTQDEVRMDPGYQFGLDQGQQAIDRKISAAGGRISGAAIKAAGEYGTNYATTGYSTAYNRINQARSERLNRLSELAGVGQVSAQQVGAAGQNMANNVSSITQSQGDASAAASLAQGNIWANTGNQLAALYGKSQRPSSSGYYNPGVGGLGVGGSPDGYW